MNTMRWVRLLSIALLLPGTVLAADLWDNGDADGSTVGYGQNSSALDDFYVEGAGAWLQGVTFSGLFLNPDETVGDVQVSIWPNDNETNEPNGDTAFDVPVQSFTASLTGNEFFEYDEIRIDVTLDPTFLQGQRYYWIEVRATNAESGLADLVYLAHDGHTFQPARYRIGQSGPATYPNDGGFDLAFTLQGSKVSTLVPHAGDFQLRPSAPNSRSYQLYLAPRSGSASAGLATGLYELALEGRQLQLYLYGPNGKVRQPLPFKVSTDPAHKSFHTPVGDEMCKNAPGELQQFCQSFVACAAHDICN